MFLSKLRNLKLPKIAFKFSCIKVMGTKKYPFLCMSNCMFRHGQDLHMITLKKPTAYHALRSRVRSEIGRENYRFRSEIGKGFHKACRTPPPNFSGSTLQSFS